MIRRLLLRFVSVAVMGLVGSFFVFILGYYGTFTWLPSFLGVKMGTLDVYQNAFILALADSVSAIGRKGTWADPRQAS